MKKKILSIIVTVFTALFSFIWQSVHAQYTKLLDFNRINGDYPYGSFISDGTYLYGMTTMGGSGGWGVVFKIKPDGTGFKILVNFDGTNGRGPYGSLVSDGTYLYGMTKEAIGHGYGNVFKVKTDGTGFQDLFDFDYTNGAYPYGSLIIDSNCLYGTTYAGGAAQGGSLFKIKTDGTGFQDLLGSNLGDPQSAPLLIGTYLYGTTIAGGHGSGNIFKIKTDGTGFQDLFDFNSTNGANPSGSLISDGTYLYGMTSDGGATGNGNLFKIKPDGTGFEDVLDFNTVNGLLYEAWLISDGTYLYGMRTGDGFLDGGNIFKVKPDGTGYEDMFDFRAANGSTANGVEPGGSLISDGAYLYGMTSSGGANGYGVVFKLQLASTLPLNLLSFTGQMQHGNAILKWQTANEINIASFTVEHAKDGVNFTPLSVVSAKNTPGASSYSVTDADPFAGENFYRLKMVDKNGSFTYSGIVKLNNENIQFAINAYPNPACSSTTLSFTTALQGKYTITIADATGKTVKRISGVSVAGANTLALDTDGLASGLYMVTYADADGSHSLKLVKQ